MKRFQGERVLVVEDEAFLARKLERDLRSKGLTVVVTSELASARKQLQGDAFDFALLDVNLPDGRGLDLLAEGLHGNAAVILMTSEGRLEVAIEALRLGAVDFLPKPFSLADVDLALNRVAQRRQAKRLESHRRDEAQRTGAGLFFGKRLELVHSQLERILLAEQRLEGRLPPVLIEGETGVGKTTIARWIHNQGTRCQRELVEVNCAALPESLAESELFGHERGAFTDAREARVGLFEAADGSTLFLDEIASLSLSIQAKILTVIEDGVVRRVGGKRVIPVDVRLIGASLVDLKLLVSQGRFREDLFHRLDLLRIRVPSLREAPEDLPRLAQHLLEGISRRYRLENTMLTPRAIEKLRRYEWPGNVRELSHELERALILEDPCQIELAQLGMAIGDTPQTPEAGATATTDDWLNPDWQLPESGFSVEAATRRFIELAVETCDGNVSAAARRLGVPRDFIRYRLKKS